MSNFLVLLALPFFASLTLAQDPRMVFSNLWGNSDNGTNYGNVTLIQANADANVTVLGIITGLNQSASHGLHIHQFGNTSKGCNKETVGDHFNPSKLLHGDRTDVIRHVGDLGNVMTDESGTAIFNFTVDMVTLFDSPNSVTGRTIVVHSGTDDLGKGGQNDVNYTGNSGGRIACGIIGIGNY